MIICYLWHLGELVSSRLFWLCQIPFTLLKKKKNVVIYSCWKFCSYLMGGWWLLWQKPSSWTGRGRKVWVSWPTRPDQASLPRRAYSTAAVRLGWEGGVERHIRGHSPQLKGETKVIINLALLIMCRTCNFSVCLYGCTPLHSFIVLTLFFFLENLLFCWAFTIARYSGDIHETDNFNLSRRWNLGCFESMLKIISSPSLLIMHDGYGAIYGSWPNVPRI